jgi:uncharacterized protein
MSEVTVAALYIYPVKSCQGRSLTSATLDWRGFVDDRRFLVVDENNRFLTQRETPLLARITPTLADGNITLARPGAASLTIPREPRSPVPREATIWRDTVRAIDLGDEAAQWLQAALHRPARLVGIGPEFSRPMRKPAAQASDEVAFADADPLLVISEASLADLNARLDFPLPMNRFRPNFVVRGASPFAEDTWRRIRIGDVFLRASGPCGRCVVTTTDQETLERGKEPLRTLASFRRDDRGEVNFGQNYIHETKSGTIGVGAPVEILE